MKKSLSILLVVILLSLTTLSSCNNKKDKDAKEPTVIEKISTAMDNVASYEADGSMEMIAYVSSQKMEMNVATKEIYSKSQSGDIYYYSTEDGSVKCMGEETLVSSLEAFNEGNYFFSYTMDEGIPKRLHSTLSQDEFLDYYKNENINPSILKGYKQSSITENEDKTRVVKLWEYDNKTISRINASFGLPLENAGGKVTDISVTVRADVNFLVNEILVDFTFSNTEFSGSQKITYSNYNKAQKELDMLKPGFYKTVEDARIASMVVSLMNDRTEDENGFFTFSNVKKEYSMNSWNTTYEEITKVYYGVDARKYYFDMETEFKGEKDVTTYRDGILKNGENEEMELNDFSAKAIIDSLIDPFNYTPLMISQVDKKVKEDGTVLYVVTIDTTQISIGNGYGSYRAVHFTYAIKDYKLISITYEVNPIDYNQKENNGVTINPNTNYNPSTIVSVVFEN